MRFFLKIIFRKFSFSDCHNTYRLADYMRSLLANGPFSLKKTGLLVWNPVCFFLYDYYCALADSKLFHHHEHETVWAANVLGDNGCCLDYTIHSAHCNEIYFACQAQNKIVWYLIMSLHLLKQLLLLSLTGLCFSMVEAAD